MKKIILSIIVLATTHFNGFTQEKTIVISSEWARPVLIVGRPGGAYLKIENNGSEDDKLISVQASISPRVELHENTMTDGVMKMGQVMAIDVAAGGSVELKPGGYHIMIFETDNTYGVGEKIDLKLNFEKAGTIEKTLEIKARQP